MGEQNERALRRLSEAIQAGELLPPSIVDAEVDEILDEREENPFESKLVEQFKAVKALKISNSVSEFEYIGDFIEAVFVHVFSMAESDDLAAYISDDFGLFAEALHLGYENEWLNAMVEAYRANKIPRGIISPVPGSLKSAMERLANGA